MERSQVCSHVVVFLLGCSASRVLDGAVECAETVNLHLLRFEQHLQNTGAELLQYTQYHVLRVDTTVFTDVLCHLSDV